MSEDEKTTEEAPALETSTNGGESSDSETPAVAAAGSVEAKLELLVNISMLTIMTLMRVIKRKGVEAIGEEELEQFAKVKENVQTAADALQEWSEENDDEEYPLDLARLRSKLDLVMKKMDQWEIDVTTIDATPPS